MNFPVAHPRPGPVNGADVLLQARHLADSGHLVEAECSYRDGLRHKPQDFDLLFGLGRLLARQGRFNNALPHLRAAAQVRADDAPAHVELALVLREAGRSIEAAPHFDRAAELSPQDDKLQMMALLHRGVVHEEQGDDKQALRAFQEAVERFPDQADAWAALGMLQVGHVGAAAAEASLRRALQIDPERVDVVERYGQVLQELRQLEDAAIIFERMINRWSERPFIAGRLLHCKYLMSDWLAVDRLQQVVEDGLAQGRLTAEPFGLQGYCASPALLRRCAELTVAKQHPDLSHLLPPAQPGRGPKIRLGYVAGEFRNQATSVLLTEVLECHDRAAFEVFAFDNGWDDGSELRKRIDGATTIVPIYELDNLKAAHAIRERQVDVLINLNGHFGRSRSQLFGLRPAPVQVNYLGFPGTFGAGYLDYIVADHTVIPDAARAHYVEKVVRLPDSYQANDSKRRLAESVTRADAGLPEDRFVFCCMNNAYKIVPAVFDVWMRLLAQVPDSVLMLYSDVPEAQVNLRHEAQVRGVDPGRILFGAPWANERHLARLRLCDLFLDTWPYNAHTTGSDALWAGLPVVTCMGPSFPSRVGASLLRAVGLPELVTENFSDYEALALRLATDRAALAEIRRRLAAQLPTAALYDTPRYTRHLEAAYRTMVERARLGLVPQAFDVPAVS
jgi:predicted O-linked N-acetylglucosamine transferase (SPINDLY family)